MIAPFVLADAQTAAAYLGISERSLRLEKENGNIAPRYYKTKPLYHIDDLRAWADGLPCEPH